MIAALMMAALVLGTPPKEVEAPAKTREKDAEIARLQGEIVRLGRERSRLRKELADARKSIAELERDNGRLTALADPDAAAYIEGKAAALLKDFFEYVTREFSKDGGAYYAARLMKVFEVGLDEWSEGDADRRKFVNPARGALKDYIARNGNESQKARGLETYQEKTHPPITQSPAIILADMGRETNRTKLAERLLKYHGKYVTWRGSVVETIDNASAPYQFVMLVDGVLVEVKVAGWSLNELRGLHVGGRAVAAGRIAEIGGNEWVGVVVQLTDCGAREDVGGWSPPPLPPSPGKRP